MSKYLPALATIIVLAFVTFSLATRIANNNASYDWDTVEAVVTNLTFLDKSVEIEYTYYVNGKEYIGNKISFLSTGTIEDRDLVKREASMGDTITVYVDPDDSTRSVFVRKSFELGYIKLDLLLISFCVTAMYVFGRRLITTNS